MGPLKTTYVQMQVATMRKLKDNNAKMWSSKGIYGANIIYVMRTWSGI